MALGSVTILQLVINDVSLQVKHSREITAMVATDDFVFTSSFEEVKVKKYS